MPLNAKCFSLGRSLLGKPHSSKTAGCNVWNLASHKDRMSFSQLQGLLKASRSAETTDERWWQEAGV